MQFFTPGDFHYDPEDDKLLEEFKSKLTKMRREFSPLEKSWDITRVDAFKNVLKFEILHRLPSAQVLFEYQQDNKRYFLLVITIIHNQFGKLSTSLSVEMIKHQECPHSLPQLVATEFVKEIKKPR